MTSRYHVKTYTDPGRCATARANLDWLRTLDSGLRFPALHHAGTHRLVFEHLGDHRPSPQDLELLADALGRLHAAAHTHHLRTARLDQPFLIPSGLTIPDFITPRRAALHDIWDPTIRSAVALYKDANIRNFLLTSDGVAIVDFDDLTLAPFGYDLAKLLVTTAMTHGALPEHAALRALDTYNSRTTNTGSGDTRCPPDRLRMFAEIHHRLTARYLHRNGYIHAWPEVRPWPRPEVPR